MRVTFINVGYGDAILVQMPDGFTALLDGGSALPEEFEGDPYRIRSIDYLKSQGIEHLDAVLISHIHEDHVCGLEPVFESLQVDQVFVPYPVEPFLEGKELRAGEGAFRSVPLYTAALNAYRRILLKAKQCNIPIHVLSVGSTTEITPDLDIRVLAPRGAVIEKYMSMIQSAYDQPGDAPTDLLTKLDGMSNRTSLLLQMKTDEFSFLMAADSCPIEWNESDIILLQNVNVLKLPHHGQIDSVSEKFMKNMPLSYVVTTSASDRRYNSANEKVYQQIRSWYPEDRQPVFLFSDEREYSPFFSRPEGFQAITLVTDSGEITPEFIKIK